MFPRISDGTGQLQHANVSGAFSASVSCGCLYENLCHTGLRLGYGLSADADLMEKIRDVIQPWSVSIPAQEAGIAALSEDTYVHNTRWLIREERKYLARALHLLEMETFDSQANYLFFKGPEDLEEQCQKRGLLIRDCSNYRGLSKGYFRIAVRTREENDQLIKIFQDIIREKQKESGAIYGWRK